MKKSYLVILLIIGFSLKAQNFPYIQQWGSYVGGSGTLLDDYYRENTGFFADSQSNLYVNGNTGFSTNYTASYYNQFVMGGGALATLPGDNLYSATFVATGQMVYGSYISNGGSTATGIANSTIERLIGIDGQDNKYYFKSQPGLVSGLATSSVWLSQYTNTNSTNTLTLTKRNSAGTLLWTTYLPNVPQGNGSNTTHQAFSLQFDENQNIYISGLTKENITGLGTPGVFQENFIPYNVGTIEMSNDYLVKLNSDGQKIWGTYNVAGFLDFDYYNGHLYSIGGYNSSMPGSQTTTGTFQPNIPAAQVLQSFDAATGQRDWGTFYGTPNSLTDFVGLMVIDIEANASGIYVTGDISDAANPTYYATAGAFQGQLSGSSDLFLSKFDTTGNRVWSTYFGSTEEDVISSSGNLTILGDRIVITGNQHGVASNIATPNAFRTTPANMTNNSANMFFAEFNSSGNRMWASYFGGQENISFFSGRINPTFLSDGSLILWGATSASTGITAEGGQYLTMTNPVYNSIFGFITMFVLKENLATTEIEAGKDLQLFNNPNNGNFALQGDILAKENCSVSIYDASGRILMQKQLGKTKKQDFQMQNILSSGNYLVEVKGEKQHPFKTFKMIVNK